MIFGDGVGASLGNSTAEGFKTRISKNLINRLRTSERIGNGSRKKNLKKPQMHKNLADLGYRNVVLWTLKFLIDGQSVTFPDYENG